MVKKVLLLIKRFMLDPEIRFGYFTSLGFFNKWPDEKFLKKKYRLVTGKVLNLDHPKSFNEKLQWLKIHDRKTVYTTMVDKYEVKKYVAGIIGEQYIIPTLGIWERFDDIDFDKLPDQFVLKCTHDSGGVFIVKDKSNFNKKEVRKKIDRCLKRNFYYLGREWPYKNVKPRIMAEKYMEDGSGQLQDYKFMCFHGEVRCCFTCTERFSGDGLKVTFFDRNWNVMPFERHYPKSKVDIPRPAQYEKMAEIATKLSKGMNFIRVDLYAINERIYFGELTFYPGCGFEEFNPTEWDDELGSWIHITDLK